MNHLLIALSIGLTAAVIDVIPMILQKLDKYACLSAFVHWMVLGIIIPFVHWDMAPWLKGLLIAEISSLPVMILVFAKEPRSILPMSIFSAILGVLVGIAGSYFII